MRPTQTIRARCDRCDHDEREMESTPTTEYAVVRALLSSLEGWHVERGRRLTSRIEWCLTCGERWLAHYEPGGFEQLARQYAVAAA